MFARHEGTIDFGQVHAIGSESARGFAGLLSGLALCLLIAPMQHVWAHGVGHTAQPTARLTPGDSTFWDGPAVGAARMPDSSFCGQVATCPTYEMELVGHGKRLRVGIDTPRRSDTFAIELIDPTGEVAASTSNSNQFNSEALVSDPAPGNWKIRVRPEDVSSTSFRMRAKLEAVLPEGLQAALGHVALLPNLRTVPPFEFTFIAPANPLNGLYPPDTVNPPLAAGDLHPISCTTDESAPPELGGAGSKHCLRFTSGPMNLGPGIYDMRFDLIDDFIAGTAALNPEEALSRVVVGPMRQIVHYADGESVSIPAGTYSFHPIHGHFHDDYVLSFELFKVIDATRGRYERVSTGTKSGFCPADQLFADWSLFNQGYEIPGGDTVGGNCFSPVDGVIGLSLGWGDVYRWQRPGMYVEFDGLGDGLYVVHSIVDANNHVMEADDSDNVSYSYIKVHGDQIDLIERGWGASPWDPHKTVFDGAGPAQRDIYNSQSSTSAPTLSSGGGGSTSVATLWLLVCFVMLRWTLRNAARAERPMTR